MKTTILTITAIIFSLNIATAQTPIDTLKNGEGKEIYIMQKTKHEVIFKSNYFKGYASISHKTFARVFLKEQDINDILNTK